MLIIKRESSVIQNYKKITDYFPQKYLLFVGIFITTAMTLITVYFSLVMKDMVNIAIAGNLDDFLEKTYFLLSLLVLDGLLSYLKTRIFGKYAEQGIAELRELMAEKIIHLPIKELEAKHSGDFISRLSNDMNKVKSFSETTIFDLLFHPLAAIASYIILLYLNWKLTLVITIVIPIIFFGSQLLSRPMRKFSKKLQEHLAVVNSINQDSIAGIQVAKAFNLKSVLEKKYKGAVADSVNSEKDLAKRRALIQSFSEFMSIIPFLITFGFGGYWAIEGVMTLGGLLAFINLLNHLTHPISMLPQFWAKAKSDMAAAERIYEVIETKTERKNGNNFSIRGNERVVEFNNLSFSYNNNGENILNNLTFSIKKGENVALVGASGSGKSTIMKIILGYYENYDGEVKLFNHKLEEWKLTDLRSKLSLVDQDSYLFPDSIKENIAYGKNDSNKENIESAAKAANAHFFIKSFENGYETDVGELGNKLSGGQKQRISIARAILKDSPILLLDEATSALDTESEHLVQEVLDNFMKDRTTIVIAHRLSTIKNVDRILVIDKGKIVEEGSHSELLAENGVYSKLYTRQFTKDDRQEEI